MLVKLSGENYIISIDVDEAASLVEDYCAFISKNPYFPGVYEIIKRLNELYYYEHGVSICSAIEQYERLEEESS